MKNLINKIHNINAFDLLKSLPNKSIDMVFSDTPYDTQSHYGARRNKKVNGLNGVKETTIDFDSFSNKDLVNYYNECVRVCKGWIINFHAYTHVVRLQNWCNTGKVIKGLDFIRAGIWDKCNTECPQLTGDRPAQGWEMIAICHVKGKKRWGEIKRKNSVYHYHTVSDKIGNHPTPKNVNMCAEIIKNFSKKGSVVLDCFTGTGVIPIAAMRTGREFIASEVNKNYYNNAKKLIYNEKDGNMLYLLN